MPLGWSNPTSKCNRRPPHRSKAQFMRKSSSLEADGFATWFSISGGGDNGHLAKPAKRPLLTWQTLIVSEPRLVNQFYLEQNWIRKAVMLFLDGLVWGSCPHNRVSTCMERDLPHAREIGSLLPEPVRDVIMILLARVVAVSSSKPNALVGITRRKKLIQRPLPDSSYGK